MEPPRPHALLLKFPGTNCDAETARALEAVGFSTKTLPIALATPESLQGVKLLVLSGGFSYGDYVMAGRVAQLIAERKMDGAIKDFVTEGGYALGICNGFQILMQLGLLPEGSLIDNTSGRFTCRWVKLKNNRKDNAFLHDLPEDFELPVAHAEGRFVSHPGKAEEYLEKGLAALTYGEDINGSSAQIAGLQDESGRVFGLMPHPERFVDRHHHYDPDWEPDRQRGWGFHFFNSIFATIS